MENIYTMFQTTNQVILIEGSLEVKLPKIWTDEKQSRAEAERRERLAEGSLEVKLPTIWTDEKQSRAEAERRGRLEERRSEEKKKE